VVVRLSGVRMLCILWFIVVSSESFTCSLSNAKRSLYRSFNAIFGRVGHIASEAVIVELLNSKCLPTLLYSLEACPSKSADLKSLDYTVVGAFMKIFKTESKDVASCCMEMLNCPLRLFLLTIENVNLCKKKSASQNIIMSSLC